LKKVVQLSELVQQFSVNEMHDKVYLFQFYWFKYLEHENRQDQGIVAFIQYGCNS